ncbi:SPW repeat domain-containing protein [Pedobacter steynii]|uniref:SPW repeat-containing integral membrane domain-containing protein n=1 Tax=Pedobacter steynii TaxID=430522 RepID=A0A1D7QJN7_9SPHI|nr:hypothetical protein [Pedobacter steynii]AOM78887.1 hypothetical protein BFS30_17945 [Pedobacter steynii]
MHFISRKFHAVLDYLSGLTLLVAPWAMGFSESSGGGTVAVFAGVVILIMSVMTDYEGGRLAHIPMSMHLNIDLLIGIFLCVSPALLGFKDHVYMPHLLIGLLSIFASLFTVRTSLSDQHKNSDYEKRRAS